MAYADVHLQDKRARLAAQNAKCSGAAPMKEADLHRILEELQIMVLQEAATM
eukprot:CAMPEP_0169301246 /NCGR_PEP_ID=MMETSP1016-20121227/68128_1 /TAXON_ID=342587 /ORGANISM="Karlodinium micrum, Strain CCMP2283" /LENGTH=51 /DNA_ID=CAMNT_0009393805 /DNA_START=270 /DNA_END=425 /DNA_ORIENTATION=+